MDIPLTTVWMAIIATFLSLVTLLVVLHQTRLTRLSLEAARLGYEQDKKVRQIENLPKMYYVIDAQTTIQQWIKEYEQVIIDLRIVLNKQDDTIMRRLAKKGLISPKNLVSRHTYEVAPEWIGVLLVTAAQYYYDRMAPLLHLWDNAKGTGNYSLAVDLLGEFERHKKRLEEIDGFFTEMLPEAILASPASIRDEKFLTDNG